MKSNAADDTRNVIPRWRQTSNLPNTEIESAARFDDKISCIPHSLAEEIIIWRQEGTLEAGVDLLDAGIILGERQLVVDGIIRIKNADIRPDERVLEAIYRQLAIPPDYAERNTRSAHLEQSIPYLHSTIRMLKKRAKRAPRDAMIQLELARLYTIVGQYEKAEHHLRIAVSLNPNGRAVLRAASQFYQVVGDLLKALPLLRRSEAIRRDPWQQSAEIAVADLTGKGSHFAQMAGRQVRGPASLETSKSELALAVATLDLEAGIRPGKVFRLVEAGLVNSTENAFAQAVWLGERTNRSLHDRFPKLEFAEDAYEAKARYFYDHEQYELSRDQSLKWLEDQPFQGAPFCAVGNTTVTHLDDAYRFVGMADHYHMLHQGDWAVQNCCLLIYATSREAEKAWKTIRSMEKLASNGIIRAYVDAGMGMICLWQGDRIRGITYYKNAMSIANELKRPELYISAYSYYLWGEAVAGDITLEEMNHAQISLDRWIERLPPEHKPEAVRVWKSISRKIRKLLEDQHAVGPEQVITVRSSRFLDIDNPSG